MLIHLIYILIRFKYIGFELKNKERYIIGTFLVNLILFQSPILSIQNMLMSFIFTEFLIIGYTDLQWYRINNSSVLLLTVFNLLKLLVTNSLSTYNLLVAMSCFTIFFILYIVANIGAGDVKLIVPLTLPLSFLDAQRFFFYTFLVATLFSIPLIIKKKDIPVPFGPFMIIGHLLTLI